MKRVLILDDDKSILEALQIAVESAGYEVKTLSSARNLIKTCQEFNPTVILSDLLLSGRDGRDILVQLRGNKPTEKLPIIMLSAHPEGELIAKQSGANEFIAKPFDIEDLLSVIAKYTT